MKILLVPAALLGLLLLGLSSSAVSGPSFAVSPAPARQQVRGIGVNLGSPTSWGAEQLLANVLPNPGFEGNLDGALIRVASVQGRFITDDAQYLGRAAGFWNGGRYSVRSGALAGVEGRIVTSDAPGSYQRLELDIDAARIVPGDIIAIHRTGTDGLPAEWWYQNAVSGQVQSDPASLRPGGGGRQSLRLAPATDNPAGVISYLDALPGRAGKLLPLTGKWRIGVWARATGPTPSLRVSVLRQGSPMLFQASVQPTSTWTFYEWDFSPADNGPAGLLEFHLDTAGAGNQVWVDDVSLSPASADDTGFRPEVVDTLQALRPGYLRDWQGQLGDTFDNRIATPDARLCARYRPGVNTELYYAYSLPEFLALCNKVGASPWVLAPTTWSDDEWTRAGRLLGDAARRYGFPEIVVEFGNENWNQLFRAAGILDPTALAAVSRRAFELMRSASGGAPLSFAVGGWYGNNSFLAQAAPGLPAGTVQAVAPYYAFTLPAGKTPLALLPQLFPDDRPAFAQIAKQAATYGGEPATYEMNAHSLGGDATPADVNTVVTSAASGTALIYRVLHSLDAGFSRQCMFSLAGFDTFRWTDGQPVRLFGLTRDLATARRFRPTGLAVSLANEALVGEYHRVMASSAASQGIMAAAFRDGARWSVVVASALPQESQITVTLPPGSKLPSVVKTIMSPSPLSNNEDAPALTVDQSMAVPRLGALVIRVPAYGLVVALP